MVVNYILNEIKSTAKDVDFDELKKKLVDVLPGFEDENADKKPKKAAVQKKAAKDSDEKEPKIEKKSKNDQETASEKPKTQAKSKK